MNNTCTRTLDERIGWELDDKLTVASIQSAGVAVPVSLAELFEDTIYLLRFRFEIELGTQPSGIACFSHDQVSNGGIGPHLNA